MANNLVTQNTNQNHLTHKLKRTESHSAQMGYGPHCGQGECGGEEQTVDHIVLQCPIHRPPHGLHFLTLLDDETIEWLLNTCPEI